MDRPFVGRERELEFARWVVSSSTENRLRLLSVTGDPGIGKTRLLQAVLAKQPASRMVIWERLGRIGSREPFAIWRSILAKIAAERATDDDIARLLAPPADETMEGGTIGADRTQEFIRVTDALRSACAGASIVLALDDLHEIDGSSARLLDVVCENLWDAPLTVALTRRSPETESNPHAKRLIERLRSSPAWHEIELRPLGEAEVRAIVDQTGASPSVSADSLLDRSEGVPAFVWALLDDVRSGGHATLESSLPETVSGSIRSRLERLSEAARELVELIAVAGSETQLAVLERCVSRPEVFRQAVDEAERYRFLVMRSPQTVSLAHDLILDAVRSTLSSGERQHAHLSLARSIERDLDTVPGVSSSACYHYRQSVAVGGLDRYIALVQRVAAEQLASFAYEDVEQTVGEALELDLGDDATAALLFSRGRAYAANARPDLAVLDLTRSFELYRGLGKLSDAVTVACFPIISNPVPPEVADLAAAALELAEDKSKRSQLMISLAFAQYHRDKDDALALERLEQAMEGLDDETNRQHRFLGRLRYGQVLFFSGELRRALDLACELAADTRPVPTPVRALSHAIAGLSSGLLAEFQTSERHLKESLRYSKRVGVPQLVLPVEIQQQLHLYQQGHLAEAIAANNQIARFPFPVPTNLSLAVRTLVQLDRLDEAREVYAKLRKLVASSGSSFGLLTLGDAAFFAEDEGMTRELLEATTGPEAGAQTPLIRSEAWFSAVLCRAQLRMTAEPGEQVLDAHVSPIPAAFAAPFSRMGNSDPEQLAAAFDTSRQSLTRCGAFLYAAWLPYKQATLAPPPELEAVQALLEQSMEAATTHNLPLLSRLCSLRLVESGSSSQLASGLLTSREQEILGLVATGLSNAEIARRLFISRHTVANHVRRILEKTDCQNRTELARYALVSE